MDLEKSRIPAFYINIDEDDTLQEDYGSCSGTSVKEENNTVDLQKVTLLENMKKQTTTKRHRNISDDEECTVPFKLYQELQESYILLKKRLREKEIVIAGKDAVIRKLRQKCKRMNVELGKIRRLNICLQEQFLLEDEGSQRIQTISSGSSQSSCDPFMAPIVPEVEIYREPPPEFLIENEFGKVDLGHGVLLDNQKWKLIQRMDSHSKFCKSLAVAIWGVETLKERTVTGSKSNAVKGSVAKPPLSPEKVGVIRECLKERLQQRGYQREAVEGQLRLVRRFLSEKICDIKRKLNVNLEGTSSCFFTESQPGNFPSIHLHPNIDHNISSYREDEAPQTNN